MPNTNPGDHGTPNTHNRWFILFYHAWGPTCVDIHWNRIWLRAQSHITSHYTWGSVTTLHKFAGVLGRPWDTFFWALTMSWSRLLARVWSDREIDGIRKGHTSGTRIAFVQMRHGHLSEDGTESVPWLGLVGLKPCDFVLWLFLLSGETWYRWGNVLWPHSFRPVTCGPQ